MLDNLGLKWCATCSTCQDKNDFNKGNHCCKKCSKEKTKKWLTKNAAYHKAYRINNRERRKEYGRKWMSKNKEKFIEWKHSYRAKRRAEDPNYRLLNAMRCRVNDALKNNKKSSYTLDLVGCTIEQLRSHIESQFESGMTWENYGNPNGNHSDCWHIDHIKPCSSFDLSDPKQQKKCFHYANLRPLWAIDNLKKGNKSI